ncbi:MAG: adenylate kinase [Luteolibacter sp.]
MQADRDAPRIAVIGTSCAGKSTFARQMAAKLALPHLELDQFQWQPGWTPAPTEVFRTQLSEALLAPGWIVDGNYTKVRDLIWKDARLIVWLDYAFPTILFRALKRTIRRAVTREVLWNGNRESVALSFFSKDSILLWVIRSHARKRQEYAALLAQPEHAHLTVVRLLSPAEAAAWQARFTAPSP